jgi:hypothetical protein
MCRNTLNRKYYSQNTEIIKVSRDSKREIIRERALKSWHKNKDKYKKNHWERIKKRLSNDLNFKLATLLRGRLNKAIRGNQKTGSAVKDLGCSVAELKTYLESKFQPGMTWYNYGRDGWHIDHIKPLSRFDLSDTSQFLEACHYTNLQPLWAEDNISKGAS